MWKRLPGRKDINGQLQELGLDALNDVELFCARACGPKPLPNHKCIGGDSATTCVDYLSPHCAPYLADTGPCFEKYNNTLRALGPLETDRSPFVFESWIKNTMGNRCRAEHGI